MKRIISRLALFLLLSALIVTGCAKAEEKAQLPLNDKGQLDYGFAKYSPPEPGEEIAVMTTSMGVIKIRLFPEAAPLAVENFKTLAGEGYYNGLIFHRVINDFMIQTGDPTGKGNGGESKWKENFKDEYSNTAFHFRYALGMARTSEPDTNGSQFFITQRSYVDEKLMENYQDLPQYFPKEALDIYQKYGGNIHLDYAHTVFGYVFEGMDVVDAIASVKTDDADKPVEDVIVEKLEIVVY